MSGPELFPGFVAQHSVSFDPANPDWGAFGGIELPARLAGAVPKRRYEFLAGRVTDPAKLAVVRRLAPIARDLGCTLAQLSLAWCLKNPRVSSVITGASRASQVVENLKALDVVAKLTPDAMARIEAVVAAKAPD